MAATSLSDRGRRIRTSQRLFRFCTEWPARFEAWAISYFRRTIQRTRDHGLIHAAAVATAGTRDSAAALIDQWFDWVSGVNTSGRELLYRADGPPESNPRYLDYQPTPVRTVHALLEQLDAHIGSSTFIDFGSGKGRVLLIASKFGFREVIGVEFDPELHRMACANILAFRGRRRCAQVRSVLGRAEEFPLPPGDLVLYFFHPFEADILELILDRVVRSYRESPRTIVLVFFRPCHAAIVERFREFQHLPARPLPFDLVRLSSSYRDLSGTPYGTAMFVAGGYRL